MPILLAAFLALWLTLSAAATEPSQPRTWTSTDGRGIEGTFVSADADSVQIRRANGTTVDIPVDKLSGQDILIASKWAEEAAARQKAEEEEARREKELQGPLTYGLSDGSDKWPADRRKMIVKAMDQAVAFINRHGKFKKHVTAHNSPGTPTADANYDGWINWGGTINRRVALHEIAHTLGIGTHPEWHEHVEDGKWTGKHAVAQLKEFDGPDAVLHADRMHFWPYGLNFDNESSRTNDLRFLKMVEAFRKDMGIR